MVYHIFIVLSGKARPSQLYKVSQLSVKKIGPRMGPCLLLVEPYWSAERINFKLKFHEKNGAIDHSDLDRDKHGDFFLRKCTHCQGEKACSRTIKPEAPCVGTAAECCKLKRYKLGTEILQPTDNILGQK